MVRLLGAVRLGWLTEGGLYLGKGLETKEIKVRETLRYRFHGQVRQVNKISLMNSLID